MKSQRHFGSILALLLLFASCFMGAAQDTSFNSSPTFSATTDSRTNTDPPSRVARIQYVAGEVSIQPGGVNDWVAADLNRPLTTSDRVWTDANSKAELNVGGGFIRLNSESSLTLTNVSNNTVQLQFDQGTLELTVQYLGGGQIYEVDTPNLAFTVMKPGVYRFNVLPTEDQTWVTVRQGYGEATGSGNVVKINAGHQVRFSNGNSLQYIAEAAPAPDGFDEWARVRDQRLDNSVSAQYVAPGVIGYQDLDGYGTWQTVAPYGPVWVPASVPVGWAPYRFGRWTWIAPWGWTWVDNAPWGFAPFHYGRWVNTGGYWGWAPGPYRYWTPCYAPALVSWVGGPGFGFGFGFGGGWGGVNVGWFPLGWGEPFYPWYHGWRGRGLSSAYIRNVNVTNTRITNVTNITNNYYSNHFTNTHYANRNINGAVTAAPQSAIAGGQPINRVGGPVPLAAMRQAQSVHGFNATPTRAAILGGEEARVSAVPPRQAFDRSVVTHARPPAPPQVSRTSEALNAPRPVAAPAPMANPAAVRAPNAGMPASSPAHPAPRPPLSTPLSTGNGDVAGYPGAASTAGVATHAVPRPPVHTGALAAPSNPDAPAASGGSHAMRPVGEPRAAPSATSSGQVQRVVPGPASPAEVQHSPAMTPRPEAAPKVIAPPTVRPPSAPMPGAAPHPAPTPSKPIPGPSPSPMASRVPQPPAGYSYHAVPMTESGAARSYSPGPSPNVHGSYAATPGYASASGYRASPAASFAGHGSTPYVPHYSTPTAAYSGGAVHYSAPAASYSGGALHSAPSGAASGYSHAMHPSGGGRSR